MSLIFLIAVFGLIASIVAHTATFCGVNPQKVFPPIWGLHVLIFVIWVPVVFMLAKRFPKGTHARLKDMAPKAPAWMRGVCGVFFAYALFNLVFTMLILSEGKHVGIVDGKKVLRGKISRVLSDDEYERYQAYEVRGFSGHWLFFYAMGTTVLYSRLKEDAEKESGVFPPTTHPC